MTCEHDRCYSHQTVEAMLAARADDLAQITAAVAALTELAAHQAKTLREQGERIDRIEAHRTTIIGEISRRLEELAAATASATNMDRPLAAAYTADSATGARDAEYIAELDAMDKARQMRGER